jgi:hypothetical protein
VEAVIMGTSAVKIVLIVVVAVVEVTSRKTIQEDTDF